MANAIRIATYSVLVLLSIMVFTFNAQQQCPSVASKYAPWYCSAANQASYSAWQQWEPVAVLATIIAFLVAVIIFMSGIVLSNEKVKSFGVGELYEALATMLIVAFFTYLSALMFGVIPSFYVSNINPYSASMNYIYQNIQTTEQLFSGVYNVNVLDSYYASINIQVIQPKINFLGIASIFTGLFSDAITIFILAPTLSISELLSGALFVLNFEFYLLYFAMIAAIPVFLVPGIILRALFPTRSVGGMLIGFAISTYMILPLLFAATYYFTNQGAQQNLQSYIASLNVYGQGTGSQQNAISPTSPLALTFSSIKTGISSYWLSIILFPSLILGIMYASIITIADFVGGMAATSTKFVTLL